MTATGSRRRRAAGVVGLAVLAPITAELLQAYLGDLGGPVGLVFFVLFLAPLYGGAALLVREVCVRTGRGWRGRLFLAAAFGVAMTTLVDVSSFTPVREDVDYWDAIMSTTSLGRISAYAAVTWVAGHVLLSVAAPLAVVETLVGVTGPWLGRAGIAVVASLMVAVAAAVHADAVTQYAVQASLLDYLVSAAVVVAVAALAFTSWGRPVPRSHSGAPRPATCLVVGFVLLAAFDLVPISWVGVVVETLLLVVAGALVLWWSRGDWSQRHVAALALGALLARTLVGFLAPLPGDTTWVEKIAQNVLYLTLVLALGVALARRTRVSEPSSTTLDP